MMYDPTTIAPTFFDAHSQEKQFATAFAFALARAPAEASPVHFHLHVPGPSAFALAPARAVHFRICTSLPLQRLPLHAPSASASASGIWRPHQVAPSGIANARQMQCERTKKGCGLSSHFLRRRKRKKSGAVSR